MSGDQPRSSGRRRPRSVVTSPTYPRHKPQRLKPDESMEKNLMTEAGPVQEAVPGALHAATDQMEAGGGIEPYLDDGTSARLCQNLAESFPPQCGGVSLVLDDLTGIDLGLLQNAAGTTWSDQPVVILGELIEGALISVPMSI